MGTTSPAPLFSDVSYQFSFTASEGENLSLATMFIQSNDWFYAFSADGLPLFSNGMPAMGDVTSQFFHTILETKLMDIKELDCFS